MKKILLFLLALSFGTFKIFAQDAILAKWTFDNITLESTNGSTFTLATGTNKADGGVNAAASTFTAYHAESTTAWSLPAGNGNTSTQSLSATKWAADDYFEFKTSTTGYNNIFLQFDAASSGTGPANFRIDYSLDGTSFTSTGQTYTNQVTTTWVGTGSPKSIFNHSFNLSTITALNNQATVFFRLYCVGNVSLNGGTIATTGTSRIDNVIISNYNVLPVSLTSFTAKANLQNIDLAWNTASEKDNSHFDILRSGDGKTFIKIGEVKGAGTTDAAHNYAFTDKNALPGVSYYQLKQVDFNGNSTLSKIEAVKSNLAASNFKVVANKQEGTVKLNIYTASEGKATFKIYDLNGHKVTEQELTLSKGYSNISVPFNGANGLHVATLTTATETVTQKFIQ